MRTSKPQSKICQSKASELIVFGGKRSGKSVIVSSLFSSRLTGQPIYTEDGTEIPNPWPVPDKNYPRTYWIIGWDTKHIGQTIFRLLFKPGQGGSFRVIEDLETGLWRTWNRADPEDRKRVRDSKLSEPLIPERYLDGGWENAFDWESKKENHFTACRLNNGNTIFAFPSSARNPKQGDAVSGIWVDEDIQFYHHLPEWQDRLTDEEGWFMWSVWPHMKNPALLKLINRADVSSLDPEPQIEKFQLVMTDNPYLSDKGKQQSLGRMETDEEMSRRNRGELLTDALSMYNFSHSMHQIQRPIKGFLQLYEPPEAHKLLLDLYMHTGGFPRAWTRYFSIDPSHTRTACHSWVIPPKEYDGVYLGNVAIAEWELVVRRMSAGIFAKTVAERVGSNNYEAFIMDQQAGRQTHAGREDNTFEVYANAFKKQKVWSRQSLHSFLPGCNVRSTRFRAVRDLLAPQPDNGLPSLMFVEEKNLETRREFDSYMKKTEARGEGIDSVLDEPANPRLFDCMASVEYFSAHIEPMFLIGQAYVSPEAYAKRGSAALVRARKIIKKQQGDEGVVYLGSGDYTANSSAVTL